MAEHAGSSRDATAATHRKKSSGRGGGEARKKLTPFNKYMQQELARLKTEHPDIAHPERFRLATANWKSAKENASNTVH